MLRALLLRLAGVDGRVLHEEERLQRNIVGMERNNEELDALSAQVSSVIQQVEEHNKRQVSAAPSGFSGEHQLNLPQEMRHAHRAPSPKDPRHPRD